MLQSHWQVEGFKDACLGHLMLEGQAQVQVLRSATFGAGQSLKAHRHWQVFESRLNGLLQFATMSVLHLHSQVSVFLSKFVGQLEVLAGHPHVQLFASKTLGKVHISPQTHVHDFASEINGLMQFKFEHVHAQMFESQVREPEHDEDFGQVQMHFPLSRTWLLLQKIPHSH